VKWSVGHAKSEWNLPRSLKRSLKEVLKAIYTLLAPYDQSNISDNSLVVVVVVVVVMSVGRERTFVVKFSLF